MKKIAISILKYIIDKVKRNRLIQNIFESPFELEKYEQLGEFTDSSGYIHQLYNGLRSKIKPGWERMVENKKMNAANANIAKLKSNSYVTVEKLESYLKTFGRSITNSQILEIGCHSGSVSFAMAERGAGNVIGSEFNGYKTSSISRDTPNSESKLVEVNEYLAELRKRLGEIYSTNNNIQFVNDDICNSNLKENSFDIVCSWEVLEHLHDFKKAFITISKLLKIGGLSIHVYNPFFCINGGHSMCTLDFLWGHTRLNETDFVNYIEQIRPNEFEKAIAFFKNGVNRMTLDDLKTSINGSGMKIHGIIPFTKEQHLRMVDEHTLKQTKINYPNVKLIDLVAPTVLVITERVK